MAHEDASERKCFTFIWKIDNASFIWQSPCECVGSPLFTVDEIQETNWKLNLHPSFDNLLGFCLRREADSTGVESTTIDFDLALLSSDGNILLAYEKNNSEMQQGASIVHIEFFMHKQGSVFLPEDTLTVRLRIRKSVGEMTKNVQCFARTHIAVETRAFLWDIENFSTFGMNNNKETYDIKSHGDGIILISLELGIIHELLDERVYFKILANYEYIKMCTFQLFIVDASKNAQMCFQDEFPGHEHLYSDYFILCLTKRELKEKKSVYLPNDVLSLMCTCAFSTGIIFQDIEATISECNVIENFILIEENKVNDPNCILIDNLKSMLNNSCLSDVKLKANSQTIDAHTFILGARSPVFKSMFSNDTKEKINGVVELKDLKDDTVLRLLRYIYSAEVEELDWANLIELYEAANKYQIMNLRDTCSSHLEKQLSVSNSCEALVIAHQHQDDDLKGYVQNFILTHGEDIVNSENWEELMESNLKLAADTLCVPYKKKQK